MNHAALDKLEERLGGLRPRLRLGIENGSRGPGFGQEIIPARPCVEPVNSSSGRGIATGEDRRRVAKWNLK
jgi:hypothetical protein